MKKIFVTLLSLILLTGYQMAQSQQQGASITFTKRIHDFGKIQEADGAVSYSFEFTNTGNTPLVITRVVASCGCTTPEWTRQPVPPGQKGYVKVTFNPRNRPGQFAKTITVMTNGVQPNAVLRVQGEVIPREKTLEDFYPYKMGNVRLKSNHIPFVKILNGQKKTVLAEVVNVSEEPVDISFTGVPPHLTFEGPGKLKPGEKGVMEITYDAAKKNDWGFVIDRIRMLQNGKGDFSYTLTISATIEDDFSGMTPEELANAPSIQFKQTTYDFGTMKQNTQVEHNFEFTNEGKSDLIIRKVSSSCGCTAVKPKENVIKPGQTSHIKTIFSSGSRVGRQNKTVTIITNDPKNTQVILRLTGNVEPPKGK
ncbi:MAG TPA: DUF1573 domain-containing protein [Bacteroidetes bacterium]|nr:DUF1573 domain-containing protein [Bacteroidota bacterium]